MGKLIYGTGGSEFEIEDRALAHLQLVMLAKVRRGESFPFTWMPDHDLAHERVTMWIFPAQHLQFVYSSGRMPDINRVWVDELMTSANSGPGLRLLQEPAAAPGQLH